MSFLSEFCNPYPFGGVLNRYVWTSDSHYCMVAIVIGAFGCHVLIGFSRFLLLLSLLHCKVGRCYTGKGMQSMQHASCLLNCVMILLILFLVALQVTWL